MKRREGFVSNSSSASFIVTFKSNKTRDEILQDISDSMLWNSYGRQQFKELKQKDDVYLVEASTSMFNDWYDIECWKFIRALSENKLKNFELYKIIKTEEEYSDCNYETTFSKFPWNYDFDDEKVEAEKDLKKNNEEYYTYLYSIDPDLEDDDKLDFSEILLSK